MPAPANNKEPVWFYPRDSKKDGVCYYIRDGRQAKHYNDIILDPHPFATSKPEFADMVFLYREPYGDRSGTGGDLVRDWYAPRSLVDDVVSLQESNGGYQSSLLFARATTPPEKDDRVEVLGRLVNSDSYTAAWSTNPDTGAVGEYLVLTLIGSAEFNGNEVYVKWNEVGNLGDIDGGPKDGDISIIARHISADTIHVDIPYDSSVTPSGTIELDRHEACYILEGYSDSESAPGVLANLFNTRTFNYALALPQDSPSYDDEMFASVITEQRVVPQTWMTQWSAGFPSNSSAAEEDVIGYAPRSKLTANRSKRSIASDPPTSAIQIAGTSKIQIPRILKSSSGVWAYAWAAKGAALAYDDAWTVDQEYWGPANLECVTRVDRYFRKRDDLSSLLTTLGLPVNWVPSSMVIPIAWGSWYVGSNFWARAQTRNITVGPALADGGSVSIILPGFTNPGGVNGNMGSTGLAAGGTETFVADQVAWGTTVLWAINTRQSRWGYWMIEALYVTLPSKPY